MIERWLPALAAASSMLGAQAPPPAAGGAPVEAAIPDRPYYPAGYRELKVAAALHRQALRSSTRERDEAFRAADEGPLDPAFVPDEWDVIDCLTQMPSWDDLDVRQQALGELALEVARLEEGLGEFLRSEVYAGPLAEFEQRGLANLARIPTAEAEFIYFNWDDDLYTRLALDVDRRRARLQPAAMRVIAGGGCGAAEGAVLVRTAPVNGTVWLISAFSFQLCRARGRDPWNVQACRWREMDGDEPTYLSGNYMYQVRWPDGSARRGMREILYSNPDEATIVTFRRN